MNLDGLALYIFRNHALELEMIGQEYPRSKFILLDFEELCGVDPSLSAEFEEDSIGVYRKLQLIVKTKIIEMGFTSILKLPEESILVGLENLPKSNTVKIKDLSIGNANRIVTIDAFVNSVSQIKHDTELSAWTCRDDGDFGKIIYDGIIRKPICPKCGSFAKVSQLHGRSITVDRQFGKIQELPENLEGAVNPPSLDYKLPRPFLNKLNPGDRVLLCGIYETYYEVVGKNVKSVQKTSFTVINVLQYSRTLEDIEITPEEEAKIKALANDPDLESKFIASFAPNILGHEEKKFAMVLQLFGGAGEQTESGDTRREIHILVIGDPGGGKSELLRFPLKVHPKAIYVVGTGASGVGLTASVQRDEDNKTYFLKPGAMVLASGGIMLLDEMDKMSEDETKKLHSGMEQGVVTVTKAGLNATLVTKTSVLAVANPKYGRFKGFDSSSIKEEFNIIDSLLDRFDLIFVHRDEIDADKDRKIAEFMMGKFVKGESKEIYCPPIDADLFKKYISYTRKNIRPSVSPEARTLLVDFYVDFRQAGKLQNSIYATARDSNGLIRLAQALARWHQRDVVTVEDAKKIIALFITSLKQSAFNVETGTIDQSINYTGKTSSENDRIRGVLDVINQLSGESKDAHIEKIEIIRAMELRGINAEKTNGVIEFLRKKEEIYFPRTGFVALSGARML
jgi:replicative DNA helicase Mcm